MNKVVVIAGPTASGKTKIATELANMLNGEIISADSMQVYKGMPIATAAPTKEEKEKATHHLVEFLNADEKFSVACWCDMAKEKIDDILSRGKVPIVAGGTGLFIDSLVDNIKFETAEIDEDLRQKLMQRDVDSLYDELKEKDPQAAINIHKNNKKRVVRALELCYLGTGKTQQNLNSRKEKSPYEFLYIILEYENRQILYDRINKRVDMMIENGLVEEAKAMLGKKMSTGAQAIGHKELKKYFDNTLTLEEATEHLKMQTRRYAKRQITWFRKRENAVRITLDDGIENAIGHINGICEEFLNGTKEYAKSE